MEYRLNISLIGLFFLTLISILTIDTLQAQQGHTFKKGFDAVECDDLLKLNDAFLDTTKTENFKGFLPGYQFMYRSGSLGFDNAWDLWLREDSTVIIMIRGTTANPKSILADFYCAMLPAKGTIVRQPGDSLHYTLADHPKAAVHGGFLAGFAYLTKDMQPKIDSLYKAGYHHFVISGHSQGGSLCYYVSAWLLHMEQEYPQMKIKTYASAAVKPGNTYFAYDYDNLTRSEWSFSIVNSSDPIPEFPFTTQQIIEDMNEPNPYLGIYSRLDKLPFIKRVIIKNAFKKVRKKASNSSKAYQKYLGHYLLGQIKNALPGLELPVSVNTTNYTRPGVPITLITNPEYFKYFEPIKDGPYYHHAPKAYRYLLRQYYQEIKKSIE